MFLFEFQLLRYLIILTLTLLGVIVFSNTIILFKSRAFITPNIADLAPAQVVIILGAGVLEDGSLTPIFKERVDTAVKIYRQGVVRKILVSGDNGTRNYNEVSPAHAYLIESGIPPEDIFLDYAGFDTYDTMYRARVVFGVDSAIVVTQSFHLPRAIFIADSLGIKVEGIYPKNDRGGWRNSLREVLSRVKAVFDVGFKSTPTYLGEQIPITGDGRKSVGE